MLFTNIYNYLNSLSYFKNYFSSYICSVCFFINSLLEILLKINNLKNKLAGYIYVYEFLVTIYNL